MSAAIITARDATLRFGHLTHPGALAIVAGTSDIPGDIVNTGSIVVSSGGAGGTQTAIFHDDVIQNRVLTVSASGATAASPSSSAASAARAASPAAAIFSLPVTCVPAIARRPSLMTPTFRSRASPR